MTALALRALPRSRAGRPECHARRRHRLGFGFFFSPAYLLAGVAFPAAPIERFCSSWQRFYGAWRAGSAATHRQQGQGLRSGARLLFGTAKTPRPRASTATATSQKKQKETMKQQLGHRLSPALLRKPQCWHLTDSRHTLYVHTHSLAMRSDRKRLNSAQEPEQGKESTEKLCVNQPPEKLQLTFLLFFFYFIFWRSGAKRGTAKGRVVGKA